MEGDDYGEDEENEGEEPDEVCRSLCKSCRIMEFSYRVVYNKFVFARILTKSWRKNQKKKAKTKRLNMLKLTVIQKESQKVNQIWKTLNLKLQILSKITRGENRDLKLNTKQKLFPKTRNVQCSFERDNTLMLVPYDPLTDKYNKCKRRHIQTVRVSQF